MNAALYFLILQCVPKDTDTHFDFKTKASGQMKNDG